MDVEQFFQLTESGFHFGHSTVLYRLDRVRAVGMFDPSQRRRHDSDLWIRMIADQTWTYDTVKSAGYRENTPGSLSKAEMECDYFYLRALVKNLDRVRSPAYRRHLAREARRAMGIAFVDGSSEHYARIRDLAWVHLSAKYRLFLSVCIGVAEPGPRTYPGEAADHDARNPAGPKVQSRLCRECARSCWRPGRRGRYPWSRR